MRAFLRTHGRLAIVPDPGEPDLATLDDQAFRDSGRAALMLEPVGPYDEIRMTPINVTSRHRDPAIRLISNFAATPFELDGEPFASVEGFWQSRRTEDPDERRRIAGLARAEARAAGVALGSPGTITFRGRAIGWGSPDHWDVMRVACRAKFAQAADARAALLATRPRPLEHRTRVDSRSIPGAIMAAIWMELREEFAVLAAKHAASTG
ncbi:MAG: hypothetical protein R2752_16895 [Vicinamibacterales bacterium]